MANSYCLFTAVEDIAENALHQGETMQLAQIIGFGNQGSHRPQNEATINSTAVMAQARALEAAFLSEMLSYTNTESLKENFSGGIGEEQFTSFLRDAVAEKMVAHGGIGLAEQLFRSMIKEHGDAA